MCEHPNPPCAAWPAGVGTGGTISGAGKFLKEKKAELQVRAGFRRWWCFLGQAA